MAMNDFRTGFSWLLLLAIATLVGLQSGCSTNKQTSGRPIDDTKVTRLVKGQTTIEEVIEIFGAPQSQSEMGGLVLYTYAYSETKNSTAIMPYFTKGQGATQSDELTITFDKLTGTVKTYSLQRGIGQNN